MKLFKMDKPTYYYQINKERLQHLNGINQDYYMKWFNINEEAYNLGSLGISKRSGIVEIFTLETQPKADGKRPVFPLC